MDIFLAEPRHAVIAMVRKNGSPHISTIWYLPEKGKFKFVIQSDSVKHRILKREPRISICVDGGWPDLRAVTINGTAKLIDKIDDKEIFSCYRRYYDSDSGCQKDSDTFRSWGEVILVEVTPLCLEVLDLARGITPDPDTWTAPSICYTE